MPTNSDQPPERVYLRGAEDDVVSVPKAKDRELVHAPEPGFYRDPFDGKMKRKRPERNGGWWWGNLLDNLKG